MNFLMDALNWILDPALHQGPDSLGARIGEHLAYTFGAVIIGALIAIPLGIVVGHTKRGAALAVSFTGGLRALPSLGVLILIGLSVGIGFQAPLATFVIMAIPPLLSGTYAGIQAVNPLTVDAARAMGMTPLQVVFQVEVPLALPLIVAGMRSAILQVVATATLAAYVSGGALGVYIFSALARRDYPQMLAASLIVIVLAFVLEGIFAFLQRLARPRGTVVLGYSK
jgi:osmoprotectant transport system permease protein